MNVERTEKVFKMFAEKVIENARGILNAKGKNSSGELTSSLDYKLKVYPSGALELQFIVPDYAKFVDKGVKGSKSSAKAPNSPYQFKGKNIKQGVLDKWAVRKNLQGVRDKKGRFIKRKTLTFLVGRSIALYGLPASHFFTDAFNSSYKDLSQSVMKAYASDVEKFLARTTKDI